MSCLAGAVLSPLLVDVGDAIHFLPLIQFLWQKDCQSWVLPEQRALKGSVRGAGLCLVLTSRARVHGSLVLNL